MPREYAHKQRHYTAEGQDVVFYCHCENTRNGFKHVALMFEADTLTPSKGTAYYYNRTWERYGYQTVCRSIVREKRDAEAERLREMWMNAHGYKRMTAKRREEYIADAPTSDRLRFLETLMFCIDGRPWPYDGNDGERERAILNDLGNVEHVPTTSENFDVYRLYNAAGNAAILYNRKTRQYVG